MTFASRNKICPQLVAMLLAKTADERPSAREAGCSGSLMQLSPGSCLASAERLQAGLKKLNELPCSVSRKLLQHRLHGRRQCGTQGRPQRTCGPGSSPDEHFEASPC